MRDAGPLPLNDLRARLVGIPLFGIVIPHLGGLFGPLGPGSPVYWAGCAWFVLLSAALWHGNRFFLVQLRRRYDWLDYPSRKAGLLLGANVLFTAPLTLAAVASWYRFAGLAADWPRAAAVTLVTVICVVFVTHVYETVDLIHQRERDLLAVARLDRARLEAELFALKSQIDPHFLFNCLNGLVHLIPRDPARAAEFTERLAEVYRYILMNRERDLVPLAEELAFAEGYVGLLRLRFGDAVRLRRDIGGPVDGYLVPPVSLQVLLENAVKHNAVEPLAPLEIRIALADGRIEVGNRRSSPAPAPRSAGIGLANLDDRCRRVAGRGLEVRADPTIFTVVLPLVPRGD